MGQEPAILEHLDGKVQHRGFDRFLFVVAAVFIVDDPCLQRRQLRFPGHNTFPRFGQLGVVAAMQGVHCTSDGPYVIKRIGRQRAEQGAYVWQKLMQSKAVVSNGTDTPVEKVSPIACFYSTVSRELNDGTVFFPDQRMSRMEALRSYTINCAYSGFEENIKGSLTPGKLADITVLSKDIMTIPEDEIPSTKVLYTIVGGKVMYSQCH